MSSPPSPAADRALLSSLALARGTVDREAARRADAEWLAAQWRDPRTRVLEVNAARAPITETPSGPALHFLAPAEVDADGGESVFLGRQDGVAYFAHLTQDEQAVVSRDATWVDLRTVGAELGDTDAGLMVTAVALSHWHATHRCCPRCGEPTTPASGGWTRTCPRDGSEHYPRTDPAIIVLVRDDADRALLGRQARWPAGWFSTLAGFVEPGESLEDAVRREVHEEAGVRVGDVAYLGSQPWPFPSSLMLGYHAWAVDPTVTVDGDEIAEARWFTRDELTAACADGSVGLPPAVSIARRLIERWFGDGLRGDWSRR